MMREIKFRAWDGDGYIAQEHLDWYSINELRKGVLCDRPCDGSQTKIVLEQYTGLKDKNGQEIYEGDILSHGYGDCKGAVVQVIYQAPEYVMKEKPKHKTWYTFILSPEQNQFEEVIGNIHENPELLKNKR
jgi:hypothetical protein